MIKKWKNNNLIVSKNWIIDVRWQLNSVREVSEWINNLWSKLTQVEIIQLMTSFSESDKTDMINNWLKNITRKDLSISDLEKRPLNLDMILWISDKDEIPLDVQNIIMRSFVNKMLGEISKSNAHDLWNKSDSNYKDDFLDDHEIIEDLKNEYKKVFKKDISKNSFQEIQTEIELAFKDNKNPEFTKYFEDKFKFFVEGKLVQRINRTRKIDLKTIEKELWWFVDIIWKNNLNLETKDLITEFNKINGKNIKSDQKFADLSLLEQDFLMEVSYIQEKWAFYSNQVIENKIIWDVKNILDISNLENWNINNFIKDYEKNLDNVDQDVFESLGLEKNDLNVFVKKILDSDENKNIEINNKNWWILNIKVSSSKEKNKLKLNLNLNETEKEIISWMESTENQFLNQNHFGKLNTKWLFYSLFAKNGEVRLADGYKIKLDNKYEWYLDFSKSRSDFKEWELDNQNYLWILDEEWEIKWDVAFLVDENGNLIKDENGLCVWIGKNNETDKQIDVIDRKIILEWEKINSLMNLFVAWKNAEKRDESIEKRTLVAWNEYSERIEKILGWNLNKRIELSPKQEEEKRINDLLKTKDNIDIWEPSESEIRKNASLSDVERIEKAKILIYKIAKQNNLKTDNLWNNILELILIAHYSTIMKQDDFKKLSREDKKKYKKIWDKYYEIGKDNKRVAGIYNYSKSQLKEKIRILQSTSWFEDWQINALMRYGICGIDPDKIEDNYRWADAAQRWIDENMEHYDQDYIDPAYAIPEAKEYYQSLPNDAERKKFVETLKNTDSGIPELEEIKNKIINDIEKNPNKWNTKDLNTKKSTESEYEYETEDDIWEKIEEKSEKEKFDDMWNKIEWYNFGKESNNWFIEWTRLFVDIGWSVLPPDDVDASWLELELVDTKSEHTFAVKVIWSDVKTDLDGKTVHLPKTSEQLSNMMSWWKMIKVPNHKKSDRNDSFEKFNKSWFFDKVTIFGAWHNQVKMEDWKLVNGNWEEIKCFSRTINTYEVKEYKWWIWKDKMWQTGKVIMYEVEPLKNGKIKVKCDFDGIDPDDPKKDVEYNHTKEMDYLSFMLFMESKQLSGYNQEQKWDIENVQAGWRHARKWDRVQRYSPLSIREAVKWIKKKIDAKSEEYKKDQQADFEHLLVSKEWLNLYWKLGNISWILWPWFLPWIQESMQSMALEHYVDRENFTWKKIEKWYSLFEKDPHFATQWRDKLHPIIMWTSIYKDRFQFAAAFLYLLKKDWPWSRILFDQMWKWFWVDKILWEKHKKRFLEFQEKRKNELEEYKKLNIVHWRQPRHSELSRLEFDYLVWVIDGRQPYGAVWEDDEHFQASKWSRTFAEKIWEWADNYFGKFDENYKKIWRISFRQAEQEWFRHMKNIRPHKALPFLKAMAVNAQSQAEEDRTKAAILGAMLSGVFKNMQDHSLRSEFWRISRAMWFLPGLWVRDTDQQENILKLLDWITSHPPFPEKFSKATGYNINNFQIDNFTDKDSTFLLHTFPRYWKSYGKDILKILQFQKRDAPNSIINLAETWVWKNWEDKNIFKFLLDKSREYIREDIDQEVAGTYWFYEHSPLTANKWVVSGIMPSNGKFEQSDNNMREAAQLFWISVWRNDDNMIPTKKVTKWETEFIFGKFFNRMEDKVFNQWNLAFFIRWLSLVKQLKEQGNHKDANYYLWYIVYWNIINQFRWFPTEFAMAMKRFLKFFEANVEQIDDSMIMNVCGNAEAVSYFKKPFEARPMEEFWDKYMSQNMGKKKSDYKKEYGKNPDKYINWQIDELFRNLSKLNIDQPSIDSITNSWSHWWVHFRWENQSWTKKRLLDNLKQ